MTTQINIQGFNLSIFKKTNKGFYLYIYNNNYYCVVTIFKKVSLINTYFVELDNDNTNTAAKINLFLRQFYLCNFTKIKFTGKGYKIKKNTKQSLIMLFNKSHTTTLWWNNIFLKKLKKYKIYIKYNNKSSNIIQTILGIRPINIFTKKGLRVARQILKKKKEKNN